MVTVTRLRDGWAKELGTAEKAPVDVRHSKPAQYYSEVRLCVFCFQFVSSGKSSDAICHCLILKKSFLDRMFAIPGVEDGADDEDGDTSAASRSMNASARPSVSAGSSRSAMTARSPPEPTPVVRSNGSPIPTRYGRRSPSQQEVSTPIC